MSQSLEGTVHVTTGGGHCHFTSKAALWVPVCHCAWGPSLRVSLVVPAPQTRLLCTGIYDRKVEDIYALLLLRPAVTRPLFQVLGLWKRAAHAEGKWGQIWLVAIFSLSWRSSWGCLVIDGTWFDRIESKQDEHSPRVSRLGT